MKFALTLLFGLILAGTASAAGKPNVLFVLVDDMGYSDLGCYGSEIATPNLDTLAKEGLRFTQCYNTARCWSSRGCLLTGYYAQQIRRDEIPGMGGGGQGKRPEWARLLPDYLKAAGYRSYHSGKWHIDGKALEGGFDRSYLLQDLGRYFSPRVLFEDDVKLPPVAKDSGYYATIAIADHAIKYLKEHAENHAGQPFFEYVAFNAPHFPLQALPEDIARYKDKYAAGWDVMRTQCYQRQKDLGLISTPLSRIERDLGPPYAFPAAMKILGPNEVNRPLPWDELTSGQREFQAKKMAIHAAMIDRMDRELGRILEQLRAMGAMDNTLIFFASDNGASAEIMVRDDGHDPAAQAGSAASHLCLGPGFSSLANTPLRRHKTWVHEGGISTPLIVHWPKGIAAHGELRHTPAHFIDMVPTILELAGISKPAVWKDQAMPPAPGHSLVKAFAQDTAISRNSLWWLHEGNRALRMGDWKIVAAKGDPWALYDLSKDRAEATDLAAQYPDQVRQMEQRWQAELEAMKPLVQTKP